jgi:hypothetical protein
VFTNRVYYRLATFDEQDGEETTSHTVGAGVTIAARRDQRIDFGYEYLDSRTDDPLGTTQFSIPGERTTTGHEVSTTYTRDLTDRAALGITGSYAWRTLESTRTTITEGDYTRWAVALFHTYSLPGTILLRADVGVSQIDSDASDGDLLLTTQSSVSYWRGPALLTLAVERGFSETFAQGEDAGVVQTTGITGSVRYDFTPSVYGLVRGGYRENETTGVTGATDRQEETWFGSVALSIQLLRWLAGLIEYTHTDLTSSLRDASYTENRVRASLTASF